MKMWIALLAAISVPASAADDASGLWREMARIDSLAALDLIAENHPGAAKSLDDRDFQARLGIARADVAARLPAVHDYGSYSALMLGLANAFGDGHIWTSSRLTPTTVSWTGLIPIRRAGQWVVGHQDKEQADPDLVGAQIVSCDGIDAGRLGRERVGGFHADASSEAAMTSRAYALLIDSGNPWAPPLQSCKFRNSSGEMVDYKLRWTPIRSSDLQPMLVKSLHPAHAGMGISDLPGGGKWIALESLGDKAEAVAADAERRAEELRKAPLVVVDLRGNGGGNSDFAERIAVALAGRARVEGSSISANGCSGAYWRASEQNLAAVRNDAATRSGDARTFYETLAGEMTEARTRRQEFAPSLPHCAAVQKTLPQSPGRLPPSMLKGRLMLVTDRACFSSCLIATDIFWRIGALHVGEETDRSTRYMEVREVVLPSGLRTFSTLMKVAVGVPDYGPFAPHVPYPYSLDDSDPLKRWVVALPR
jgi:hypothetical protein